MITNVQCSIPSQLNNMPRVVVTDFRLHHHAGMSIWRYGANSHILSASKEEIRLGSAWPASSVGKARPPYFTARVYTSVYYQIIFNFIS